MTFGIYLHKQLKEPILLIKTSWGSTSLHTDWHSPSAGPFVFSQAYLDETKKSEGETKKMLGEKAEQCGKHYRMMLEHVQSVLADVGKVCPDYDPKKGYEVVGFVWFQGVHDLLDKAAYPKVGEPDAHAEYTRLLACLIRDLRKDLTVPEMRVVIGEIGLNGDLSVKPKDQFVPVLKSLRAAQAATAQMEEFKGTIASVDTSRFWEPELERLQTRWDDYKKVSKPIERDKTMTGEARTKALDDARRTVYTDKEWEMLTTGTSHAGYHYMGSAKIYARIGKAFAESMAKLTLENSESVGEALQRK